MKVIKNYLYNASYQLLALILPIITAPYVSRTLGPRGVGQYSYTYSIITWFTLITSIGIAYYGDRQVAYVRKDHQRLSRTFWELQIIKICMTIISLMLFMVLLRFYHHYTFLLWLQVINIIASTVDISWLYMGLENFKVTVTRNTIVKAISVILIFTFVHTYQDTWKYVIILGMSLLIGNLTLWPSLRKILVPVKFHELRPFSHLKESLILFLPSVATKVYLTLNKTVLGVLSGATAAGFYNNSDALIQMVIAIVTATGTVILPHVANEYANGNVEAVRKTLYKSFDFVSFVSIPMAFGVAGIALKLSKFFYGRGFAPVGPVMMIESIIIVLVAWSNAIGIQYLLPMKRTNEYTKTLVTSAIVSVLLSFPLIYLFGLHGAIMTTVIAEAVVAFYQLVIVHRELDMKRLFKDIPKFLIAGLAMFVVVFWFNITIYFNIFTMLFEVLVGVALYALLILLLRPAIVDDALLIVREKLLKKRGKG